MLVQGMRICSPTREDPDKKIEGMFVDCEIIHADIKVTAYLMTSRDI